VQGRYIAGKARPGDSATSSQVVSAEQPARLNDSSHLGAALRRGLAGRFQSAGRGENLELEL